MVRRPGSVREDPESKGGIFKKECMEEPLSIFGTSKARTFFDLKKARLIKGVKVFGITIFVQGLSIIGPSFPGRKSIFAHQVSSVARAPIADWEMENRTTTTL